MNCIEILEYISAVVDGQSDSKTREEFDGHIARCPSCRNDLELHLMAKRIISGKLPHTQTPGHLRASILHQLPSDAIAQGIGGRAVHAFFEKLHAWPRMKLALVLGVVVVVTVFGVTVFTHREPELSASKESTADMTDLAVQHYSSYLRGAVKLQLVSSSRDEVRTFFKDKVSFDVYVPMIRNAQLVGGVLCEHEGTKFLNLVYRLNDKIVYFYTGCSKEMSAGGKIGLSAKAQSDLKQSGWHFDTSRGNCSVAVWQEKDGLCSVVADMKKEEILALLKD